MEELMEWLARNELLRESQDVLVAYLDLLTALAGSPEGARGVTQQLMQAQGSYDIVSWERMFSVLAIIRQRYADSADKKVRSCNALSPAFLHRCIAPCACHSGQSSDSTACHERLS